MTIPLLVTASQGNQTYAWIDADRLDFYFQYDSARHGEIVYNQHAENGETSVYIPSMPGWGTGETFAIIALLTMRTRQATDMDSIARLLREHGVNVYASKGQFELLLCVNTMASSTLSMPSKAE
jgi:hypothetical protein